MRASAPPGSGLRRSASESGALDASLKKTTFNVLPFGLASEDLAVSLSDQALDTVRAKVPSTFHQFEFIAAGKPANALVPDALYRWLR